MKIRFLLLYALLLLLALVAGFWLGSSSSPASVPSLQTTQRRPSATTSLTASDRDLLSQQSLRAPSEEEPPFWLSAIVLEPENPRMPTAAVVPPRIGPPVSAAETAARVKELEAAPSSAANAGRLNEQVIVWYAQDPLQATAWLNATPRFAELAPALSSIAAALGERGHLDVAHEVLENIADEETRRAAILDVYSLQARNGRITRESLTTAGWDPADIELVFQGD